MRKSRTYRNLGFSLLELVIVVVIIGIIAAIAIPRMSRGAAGAADSALRADLAVLRNAIDLYAIEHGGTMPAVGTIINQLTQYSDNVGVTSATQTPTHIYGPYLRQIPPLPVGARKGQSGVAATDGSTIGWIYGATEGTIKANTTIEEDVAGVLYNTY